MAPAASYLPVLYPSTLAPIASTSAAHLSGLYPSAIAPTGSTDYSYDPVSLSAFLNLPVNNLPIAPLDGQPALLPLPSSSSTLFHDATFASFVLPPALPSPGSSVAPISFEALKLEMQSEEEDVKPFVGIDSDKIEELLRLGMGDGPIDKVTDGVVTEVEDVEAHGHEWLNSDP